MPAEAGVHQCLLGSEPDGAIGGPDALIETLFKTALAHGCAVAVFKTDMHAASKQIAAIKLLAARGSLRWHFRDVFDYLDHAPTPFV